MPAVGANCRRDPRPTRALRQFLNVRERAQQRGATGGGDGHGAVVQCEASNWAELARAHEKAATELEALGLHLPQLIGGAGEKTTACMACGDACLRLFHFKPDSTAADELVTTTSDV